MKRRLGWALLLACLAPVPGRANVYYVSQGVKYHIGDKLHAGSGDEVLMAAYPLAGTQWIQSFTVDRPDMVHVRIDHIWGVRDCSYCKDMIWIDGRPLARLFAVDNHQAFTTPDELTARVEPGRVHELKISSEGTADFDDYLIQNVVVESAVAQLTFIGTPVLSSPGLAPPPPPPHQAGCGGALALAGWLPGAAATLSSVGQYQARRGARALAEGGYAQLRFRVDQVADVDAVSQALELRLGGGDGWVLSWAPGQDSLLGGNLRLAGRYRAAHFGVSGYRPGQWNLLRVSRCGDGRARLSLNGEDLGPPLAVGAGSVDLEVGVIGLQTQLQEATE